MLLRMSGDLDQILKCQICKDLSKRSVRSSCCRAQACRACAFKQVLQSRRCWNLDCGAALLKTDDLKNDEDIRFAVEKFKSGLSNQIPADMIKRIQDQYKAPDIELVCTPAAAASPASQAQASKTAVCSPATKSAVPAPQKQANKTAVSTPANKSAVGANATQKAAVTTVTPTSAKTAVPSVTSGPKTAVSTPIAIKTTVSTPVSNTASHSAKRKSDALPASTMEQSPKMAKLDKKPLKIYVDGTLVITQQLQRQLAQICLRNSETGEQLFSPVALEMPRTVGQMKNAQLLHTNLLSHLNIKKVDGFRSTKSPLVFQKADARTVDCEVVYGCLTKMVNFLRDIHKKNLDRELVFVMYTETLYKLLLDQIKKIAYYKETRELMGSLLTVESYLVKQKPGHVMVPIHQQAGESSPAYSVEDTVRLLEKIDRQQILDQDCFLQLRRLNPPDKVSLSFNQPKGILILNSDKISLQNWISIDQPKHLPSVAASSSVTASKPTVPTQAANGTTSTPANKVTPPAAKPVQPPLKSALKRSAPPPIELEEIVILEDEESKDPAETVFTSGLFPNFVHPTLVRLNSLEAGTRAISFTDPYKTYTALGPCKVYKKGADAYAFFAVCSKLSYIERFKSAATQLVTVIPERTSLGRIKQEPGAMEETRPFAKIVKADVVFASDPNCSGGQSNVNLTGVKFNLDNNTPSVMLVKLVPHDNAALKNKAKGLNFTSTDVFLFLKPKLAGLEPVTHLFSPERRGNLAKVVFRSKSPLTIMTGQVLGTVLLFQEENLPLVLLKAEQHAEVVSELLRAAAGTSTAADDAKAKVPISKLKRPCSTLASSRLYSRVDNQLLVRLEDYEVTGRSKRFYEALIENTSEFVKNLLDNKAPSETLRKKLVYPAVTPVFWVNNLPYAFIKITLAFESSNMPEITRRDVKASTKVATYTPVYSDAGAEPESLEMSACVDINEKGRVLTSQPMALKVYLKFTTNEIPKKDVLQQIFCVKKIYNTRIRILNSVIKPLHKNSLAPQRTQTNDMQAILIVVSESGPVSLNPREVVAELSSVGSKLTEKNPLKSFESCGVKFDPVVPDIEDQEMEEMEMFEPQNTRQRKERQLERVDRMKARAREFQNGEAMETRRISMGFNTVNSVPMYMGQPTATGQFGQQVWPRQASPVRQPWLAPEPMPMFGNAQISVRNPMMEFAGVQRGEEFSRRPTEEERMRSFRMEDSLGQRRGGADVHLQSAANWTSTKRRPGVDDFGRGATSADFNDIRAKNQTRITNIIDSYIDSDFIVNPALSGSDNRERSVRDRLGMRPQGRGDGPQGSGEGLFQSAREKLFRN